MQIANLKKHKYSPWWCSWQPRESWSRPPWGWPFLCHQGPSFLPCHSSARILQRLSKTTTTIIMLRWQISNDHSNNNNTTTTNNNNILKVHEIFLQHLNVPIQTLEITKLTHLKFLPSNFDALVNRTDLAGMFSPIANVSVAQRACQLIHLK